MKVVIVQNTAAEADPELEMAVLQARKQGHAIERAAVEENRSIVDLVVERLETGLDRIIAAGGDGTVNGVAQALHETQAEAVLAVIPYGTGNDFATAAGIPLSQAAQALDVALHDDTAAIDLGTCGERVFVNAATGGFGAEVTATTAPEAKEMLGRFSYTLTGLARFPGLEGRPMRLRWDRGEWEGRGLGFCLANGRQTGGGFMFAPGAHLNDGQLHGLIVPEEALDDLPGIAAGWLNPDPEAVTQRFPTFTTAWAEVESADWRRINLDGESLEGQQFQVEIEPQAIRVCLPRNCPLLRD